MTKNYLQIFLTLITLFAINAVKSDDTVEALQKILKELNAQVEERYEDGNHISKIMHHPRHYKTKHSKGSPNLMNIQTMNLFLKPNKRQQEEADVKRFPHTAARADMCKTVGRCGCSGARCGTNREDVLADKVDRVINEINNGLVRDDDWHTYGDGVHVDDERDKRDEIRKNDIKDDINRDRDEDDLQRDRDDEDVTKKEDKYDDYYEIKYVKDDKYDDKGKSIVDRKNRVRINDFLNSKRFKVNNNLDAVILGKSDLDILLRNEDFVDLSRKDVDKNDEDNDIIYEKVRKEFKKIVAAEDKTGYKSGNVITVQDLFFHFENVRQQAVAQMLKYLKNDKINLINLKYVSPEQKKLLLTLKMKYISGQIEDNDLGEEIENIIFGEHSNMKIAAQTKNSNIIYIPQWIYDKVITSKKKLNEPVLRNNPAQKHIFPLSKQQKKRLSRKEKGLKYNPKILMWRKNAGQDIRRFGIPFEFEVHGLGQVAP